MTTTCLENARLEPADHQLRDAVVAVAVAVIFIIPATLAGLSLL